MTEIVTIAERKARAAQRLAAAVDAVMADLRRFASERGGRFLVFGSAAKGTLGYDSDLDVLIDVPPELETEAWDTVEEACRTHGIRPDIHSTATAAPSFVARVSAEAVVLG